MAKQQFRSHTIHRRAVRPTRQPVCGWIGALLIVGHGVAGAQSATGSAAQATAPVAQPATESASKAGPAPPSGGATAPSGKPSAPSEGEAQIDFPGTLRELRRALADVTTLRLDVQKRKDKVKEACVYDRQRSLQQAVESAELAQAGFEKARTQGEQSAARTEQARALSALTLGRTLRQDAENCVGADVSSGTKASQVSVKGPGTLDDAQPGPREPAKPHTLRLELPSRPNPASAFRGPGR
jgi:hypothetical protein